MSPTVHSGSSAICPGQQALFHGGDHHIHMLRVAAMVYWMDAPPSIEIFYLSNRPFRLSPTSISDLETEIVSLLQTNDDTMRALRAIYIGYSGVEMTQDDVTEADWRVITGAIPTPAPTPTAA